MIFQSLNPDRICFPILIVDSSRDAEPSMRALYDVEAAVDDNEVNVATQVKARDS